MGICNAWTGQDAIAIKCDHPVSRNESNLQRKLSAKYEHGLKEQFYAEHPSCIIFWL